MTNRPYQLTAMGMVNALGAQKDKILRRLLVGDTQHMTPRSDLLPGRTTPAGMVTSELPEIPTELMCYKCRNNQILQLALQQIEPEIVRAIEQYGACRIGVVLGSSTTGIGAGEEAITCKEQTGQFPENYAYIQQELGATSSFVAEQYGLKGPCLTVSTACSSSARVFASGRNLLSMGLCDAVIIGGADSICRMTLQGFASLGAISDSPCNPMSQHRDGINIGEAATVFLLEQGADVNEGTWLLGVGDSSDAHHISAPDPKGSGARASMEQALRNAALSAEKINYINLHGTATPLNDAMESKAVAELFGNETPCSSTKPLIGHTLGAAGATEVGFCWLLLQEQKNAPSFSLPPHIWDGKQDPELPPIHLVKVNEKTQIKEEWCVCLSNSFAFGGNNCSVIVGAKQKNALPVSFRSIAHKEII